MKNSGIDEELKEKQVTDSRTVRVTFRNFRMSFLNRVFIKEGLDGSSDARGTTISQEAFLAGRNELKRPNVMQIQCFSLVLQIGDGTKHLQVQYL